MKFSTLLIGIYFAFIQITLVDHTSKVDGNKYDRTSIVYIYVAKPYLKNDV